MQKISISPKGIAKRWERSTVTVWRYRKAGIIPAPDFFVNGDPRWWVETIEKVEEKSTAVA